ncbi:MAG: glycosyltransferase family 1 protein [Deltaproteobacteria bacterium]|nr:MAG: glycosyltransferase family 1 protein [Deltaproteobacteria bacterium]
MKIALLRQKVAAPGGAEATLIHLARGLAAAGHEVAVYGTDPPTAAQDLLGPGINYVPVPVLGGKTGRVLTYALNVRKLLRQTPGRLVFSLERTLSPQVYRAGDGCHREWLQRRRPYLTPGARLAQDFSPFHRMMLGLEKRLFTDPRLLRVIANSRQVQREIEAHYGLDPAKIRVIYNGLNHNKFRPLDEPEITALKTKLGLGENSRVVLFVGSGFARKGLHFLLEAFAGLKNQKNFLWVVGKGPLKPYQQLARRLGVAARVRFWGPQPDTAAFYQAATVVALPTIYDPCSNVVLEGLSCGCPVVTTAANGAGEFITPGANGAVLARPHDVPALAQALDEYLDRGREGKVREAAQEAVAHLSWETTVARTLEVLKEAAAASAKGWQKRLLTN